MNTRVLATSVTSCPPEPLEDDELLEVLDVGGVSTVW
jgi:hypothetical protein